MNVHLKNAELVRKQIEHLLPAEGPMSFDDLNVHVKYLVNTTKSLNNIPLSMSSLIANFTLANFVSQFQIKLMLDSSKIPLNVVGFVLAHSGSSKDTTIGTQEKAMGAGYNVIDSYRKEKAKTNARNKSEQEDGDTENWMKYFKEPPPLTNSISTIEGLVSRLNLFAKDGIGMSSVVVSELGSELASNPNMTDNIKLVAMLYDIGEYKSKAIKDHERQDQEVKGMGMNALFVGSEDNIIMDKRISQTFKMEFITKLARRSMFVYPTKKEFADCVVEYADYEDMKTKQELYEDLANEGRAFMNSVSMEVATQLLDRENKLIGIDEDALQAYKDYKMYTNALGNGLDYLHKSVQLEMLHRSWRMLKLAGVYALMDTADNIEMKHIKQSIYYIEKIGKYMDLYEDYASKEEYEHLVDLLRHRPEIKLNLHELKKKGFITGTSNLSNRLKELAKLADSLAGSDGIVAVENDIIYYKPFEAVGEHYASYITCTGTKEERAVKCHSGFEAKATTFTKLKNLLCNDVAYTPFKFKDGKRSNDNIISGATWVALDVDDSDLTISEMHDMLVDFNHHIGTTSDSENPYKFRIIIEFSKVINLNTRQWKVFGKVLGEEIGIKIDPVTFTKSQIMFGYKDAKVFSTIDAEPYDVTNALKEVERAEALVGPKKLLTRTQMASKLDNPLETFAYAFSDDVSARSLTMFRMWKHAKDLGATAEQCEQLMRDLNYNFWSEGVSDSRFEGYVAQMRRSFDEE